jgi:hypothetical protein
VSVLRYENEIANERIVRNGHDADVQHNRDFRSPSSGKLIGKS